MYSLTMKVGKSALSLNSYDEIDLFIRETAGAVFTESFVQELATCVNKGWIINRARKTATSEGFSFTFFSKTLSNLKSFQDFLESSSDFNSIVSKLKENGCSISSDFGQEADEFAVYDIQTSLVPDTLID